jgi:hypothetical protein
MRKLFRRLGRKLREGSLVALIIALNAGLVSAACVIKSVDCYAWSPNNCTWHTPYCAPVPPCQYAGDEVGDYTWYCCSLGNHCGLCIADMDQRSVWHVKLRWNEIEGVCFTPYEWDNWDCCC